MQIAEKQGQNEEGLWGLEMLGIAIGRRIQDFSYKQKGGRERQVGKGRCQLQMDR